MVVCWQEARSVLFVFFSFWTKHWSCQHHWRSFQPKRSEQDSPSLPDQQKSVLFSFFLWSRDVPLPPRSRNKFHHFVVAPVLPTRSNDFFCFTIWSKRIRTLEEASCQHRPRSQKSTHFALHQIYPSRNNDHPYCTPACSDIKDRPQKCQLHLQNFVQYFYYQWFIDYW